MCSGGWLSRALGEKGPCSLGAFRQCPYAANILALSRSRFALP
jgi:hypothetical protein